MSKRQKKSRCFRLHLADWPKTDREMWLSHAAYRPGPLDFGETALPQWRASCRKLFETKYSLFLGWLKGQDLLGLDAAPATRVTRATVLGFVRDRHELGHAYSTLEGDVRGLRHIMRILGPENDWSWMRPIIAKFRIAIVQKQLIGLPSIGELFRLGISMMEESKLIDVTDHASLIRRSVRYRNGLAIAMLAARPVMRLANLTSIQIGKQLRVEFGHYSLHFKAEEMKQKRSYDGALPIFLKSYIDEYVSDFRNALFNGKPDSGQMMWIVPGGCPLPYSSLQQIISSATEKAFGVRVTPHRFRHCAGTSMAKEAPENILMVKNILGHADFKVSEKFYIMANDQIAFASLDNALTKIENGESMHPDAPTDPAEPY